MHACNPIYLGGGDKSSAIQVVPRQTLDPFCNTNYSTKAEHMGQDI
jgi:hypothetical protein